MVHNMKLQGDPFKKIKSGSKTFELRLLDEKRRLLNVGDIIEFLNLENKTQKIRAEIIALHKFESFIQLYNELPLEKCGYDVGELSIADPSDMEQYYTPEEQEKYGVVGIEIKLLENEMIEIRKTTVEDVDKLFKIQREAFRPLYEKYKDEGNPHLRDERDISERLGRPDSEYYTIIYDEQIVGGILYKHHCSTPFCEMLKDGEYYLCRVYIKPSAQGKQIARTAIKLCEELFADAKKFYVDFPDDLEKNRRCYTSVGYADTGKRLNINEKLILACYVKER